MRASPSRILVVDDDDFLRENIEEYLTERGFQVLTAENGRIGLDTLRQEQVDLVLLDLRMPEMDGLEVLEIVTAELPETPVVVVSGMGVNSGDTINTVRHDGCMLIDISRVGTRWICDSPSETPNEGMSDFDGFVQRMTTPTGNDCRRP